MGNPAEEFQQVRRAQEEFGKELCRRTLAAEENGHLNFALAGLWLDERVEEANERLRQARQVVLGEDSEMNPEAAVRAKWAMRGWLRVYYLFSAGSRFFPGRLTGDVQDSLEEMFWHYGYAKSTVERARLEYIWAIQGSENHDMMDLSNAFLALQAVQDLPSYQDRKLRDGLSAREHVAAWIDYYRLYCDERAKRGLYVEVDSPTYGKYFLPELVNMFEFAADELLREKMEMLLHLTWADWAVDQLGGQRGGGKTRSYHGHYSQRGTSNAWRSMGLVLLGQGNWFDVRHQLGPYVLGTTQYRLPDLVIDLALNPEERGEYVYKALRPGKMVRPVPADLPSLEKGMWYVMDSEDQRLLRYDYCTPDYIMGSWWMDPRLGTAFRVSPELDYAPLDNYAAISAQNRWQGVIFATHANARVFPQCMGEDRGEHSPTFNEQVAVQRENVMLVQQNHKAEATSGMRVFFAEGMKERLVEREPWFFLQEDGAYLAVGILPRLPDVQGQAWEGDHWLRPADEYAPLAFVGGRVARWETLDAFIAYVERQRYQVDRGVLKYAFEDAAGTAVELELELERVALPRIDGKEIDLQPVQVYDCPYLSSERGSGVVTISKGERLLTLYFDQTRMEEEL